MPSPTQAALVLGGAVLAVYGYLKWRDSAKAVPKANGLAPAKKSGKAADCSFTHVGPYPGDPIKDPPPIYTDHVKTTAYKAAMGGLSDLHVDQLAYLEFLTWRFHLCSWPSVASLNSIYGLWKPRPYLA